MAIVGCSPASPLQTQLEDYTTRLARVLETTAPDYAPLPTKQRFPLRQDMPVFPADVRINLREFYALQQCAVAGLIAQRNTALGHAQLPSSRFAYQLQVIEGLIQCRQQLEPSPGDIPLDDWIAQKQQNLPLHWAQLVQHSQEIAIHFDRAEQGISADDDDRLTAVASAWKYLLALPKATTIDGEALEHHLQQLKFAPLPAKLQFNHTQLGTQLPVVTAWLEQQQLPEQCRSPQFEQGAQYLANVFKLVFVQRIQPFVSTMNHYHYTLLPVYQQLLDTPTLSPAFKARIQHQLDTFSAAQNAVRAHIAYWQQFFDACDLHPG